MLLVHDLNTIESNEIMPLLQSNSKIFSKEINNITDCLGCFNCWIKTPGRCIVEDSYTEMPKYILENGSPRKERSGSSYLISELTKLLNNNVNSKEYYISNLMRDNILLEEITTYDKIIFVSTLYADCFPSAMLELMAAFENFIKGKNNIKLDMYCMINCRFIENNSNDSVDNILVNAKIPKFIFKLAGNIGWKSMAKKNNLKPKDLYKQIY